MCILKSGNIIAGRNKEYTMIINDFSCKCVLAIFFTWAIRLRRAATNDHRNCGYNLYKDGDVCRDCPIGYFGDNCSNICTPPSFGFFCGQKCSCLECHHIFGCNFTTNSPEAGHTSVEHTTSPEQQIVKNTKKRNILVETTTYSLEDRIEETTRFPKRAIIPEVIVIVSFGSFISLLLMYEICRELTRGVDIGGRLSLIMFR